MNNTVKSIVLATLVAWTVCGCKVDERYDLNNLDTEATLFKGATFPIGNLKPFVLNDFFNLDGNAFITVDAAGDYHLHFRTDPFEFSVTAPPVSGSDLSFTFEPVQYKLGTLPPMLNDPAQHVTAQLSELEVALSVDSSVPATFSFGAVLSTVRNKETLHQFSLDGLSIASGKTEFVFNGSGSGERNDVIYKQISDISTLLSPIPDMLEIKDMTVHMDPDQSALLVAGSEYGLSGQAVVDSPLSFTADSRMDLEIPIDDAKMELDVVGLKKAVLNMEVTNTIPLSFSAEVSALSADGSTISSVSAKTDRAIAAGTAAAPVKTPLAVTLTTDGDLRFQGLRLKLSAASDPQVAGTHLNKAQGLECRNLVLSLPDGVQVKLDIK